MLAATSSSGPGDYGGGGGKISRAQESFNEQINEDVNKLLADVKMLKRLDTKMNKELVSKPYIYIDKVKEELAKE